MSHCTVQQDNATRTLEVKAHVKTDFKLFKLLHEIQAAMEGEHFTSTISEKSNTCQIFQIDAI